MKYVFGADIGGTTVKLGLFPRQTAHCSKSGRSRRRSRTRARPCCGTFPRRSKAAWRRGISRTDVLGIGAGIPGPVTADGTVNRCVNLGWGVFNVSEALARISGFPVESANDANVAALGEYWMGGGRAVRICCS